MSAKEERKVSLNGKDLSAKNHRQELVEGDVLDLCRIDMARLLITRLSRMGKVVTRWSPGRSFRRSSGG